MPHCFWLTARASVFALGSCKPHDITSVLTSAIETVSGDRLPACQWREEDPGFRLSSVLPEKHVSRVSYAETMRKRFFRRLTSALMPHCSALISSAWILALGSCNHMNRQHLLKTGWCVHALFVRVSRFFRKRTSFPVAGGAACAMFREVTPVRRPLPSQKTRSDQIMREFHSFACARAQSLESEYHGSTDCFACN